MLEFIQNNVANIIIIVVLAVVCGLIIRYMIKQHKNGGSCGDCSSCGKACSSAYKSKNNDDYGCGEIHIRKIGEPKE